jgi:trimethylamine-N-oxide reductase (cytochrome c)
MDDVGCSQGDSVTSCAIQEAASDTVGESMSDYEIAQRVGAEFGEDTVTMLTGGMTVEEWLPYVFKQSAVSKEISFEEFKEKGYYIPEFREDWDQLPSGQADFYNDPDGSRARWMMDEALKTQKLVDAILRVSGVMKD